MYLVNCQHLTMLTWIALCWTRYSVIQIYYLLTQIRLGTEVLYWCHQNRSMAQPLGHIIWRIHLSSVQHHYQRCSHQTQVPELPCARRSWCRVAAFGLAPPPPETWSLLLVGNASVLRTQSYNTILRYSFMIHPTIYDLLRQVAARFPDRNAIRDPNGDEMITFSELDGRVSRTATGLVKLY